MVKISLKYNDHMCICLPIIERSTCSCAAKQTLLRINSLLFQKGPAACLSEELDMYKHGRVGTERETKGNLSKFKKKKIRLLVLL